MPPPGKAAIVPPPVVPSPAAGVVTLRFGESPAEAKLRFPAVWFNVTGVLLDRMAI